MKFKLNEKQMTRLRKLGVSTLYLFGSHAQGVAGPLSDVDFAVLLKNPSIVKPGKDVIPLYQNLYDVLTDLLPKKSLGPVTIDIVFLQSGVSLELQANVVKYGRPLLDDDPRQRADYEAQVMIRMADFRPILQQIDEAILASI